MVLSGSLFSLHYGFFWWIAQKFFHPPQLAFYCGEMIDYYSFEPLLKHLPGVTFLASDHRVRKQLKALGIKPLSLPAFPQAVIMCRHATHKFPSSSVVRIGLRHGAYHFKRLTKAANYNRFDLYLFTSRADLKAAESIGVKVGRAVGFPRLDPVFNGSFPPERINALRQQLKLDPHKPTLLFTATWDRSRMSAISLWCNRLGELTRRYNVLATAHPWTERGHLHAIRSTPGVRFIREADLIPYILLANVVIGDTSSLLADCCALDKPILIFRTSGGKRRLPEIDSLLRLFTLQIKSFDELPEACDRLLKEHQLLKEGRAQANAIMFDHLDGKAGQRAAEAIMKLLRERKICP